MLYSTPQNDGGFADVLRGEITLESTGVLDVMVKVQAGTVMSDFPPPSPRPPSTQLSPPLQTYTPKTRNNLQSTFIMTGLTTKANCSCGKLGRKGAYRDGRL